MTECTGTFALTFCADFFGPGTKFVTKNTPNNCPESVDVDFDSRQLLKQLEEQATVLAEPQLDPVLQV